MQNFVYEGYPLECLTDNWKEKIEIIKVITTYCWTSSLYTKNKISGKIRVYYSYYKWISFMLFFQAITFYVPHLIWKIWEGGKIQMITKDIRKFNMNN